MAFEVTKTTVYRLSVSVSCGCKVGREFSDPRYKEPLDKSKFESCLKHNIGCSTIEFILQEYLDTEVQKAQNSPSGNLRGEEVRNEKGEVIGTRVMSTGAHRPQPKVRSLPPRIMPGAKNPASGSEIDSSSLDAMIDAQDLSSETITPE